MKKRSLFWRSVRELSSRHLPRHPGRLRPRCLRTLPPGCSIVYWCAFFFATDRQKTGSGSYETFDSAGLNTQDLQFGEPIVTIPATHITESRASYSQKLVTA